ncbi:glycosyltransferase family 4 protein [Peniophora sp. CONT]|nr:glycosyltransferase family 4 protein [Peniophora sp. CONT]
MPPSSSQKKLRIAFVHPDLGIGGAERLVVDAALGLQNLGHHVEVFTSHHDPAHCFDETRDGTLKVHAIHPPLPRAIAGKLHILLAHLAQLHLTTYLLRGEFDVFFVDQLSTCVPLLRAIGRTPVVFYCHFPDKLLAHGAFVDGPAGTAQMRKKGSALKRAYRVPMDWLEERTTSAADVVLANSRFTARVFKAYFPSIRTEPAVVYPGVNLATYEPLSSKALEDPDVLDVLSDQPTFLSINRFESKKNVALALAAFAALRARLPSATSSSRLVLAGGYDPRVGENIRTLSALTAQTTELSLSYTITKPASSPVELPSSPTPKNGKQPDVLFLLNFSTAQRAALLNASSTVALLYTPTNEHFGIGPVEGMACGLPVIATDTGGPTESILSSPASERTGWLRAPEEEKWAEAMAECIGMSTEERTGMAVRGRRRAKELFGMDAMAISLESALRDAAARGPLDRQWGLLAWLLVPLMALMGIMYEVFQFYLLTYL